jgi:ERCC4-related helicase
MPRISDIYSPPPELLLGTKCEKEHPPVADQRRQRAEVDEILRRLRKQPGVILADEVGMGKTFVALAVAYSIAAQSSRLGVVVMVPPHLIDKWEQDLTTFCERYLENRHPVRRDKADPRSLTASGCVRYGVARHSIELMKLLDDPPRLRCHLIFLAQGAMGRRQTDKWIRLALIAEALRRHGRGRASRLIQVKNQIHRFIAELLMAIGEERAQDWGEDLWQRLLQTEPAMWRETYNQAVRDERRLLVDDPVPNVVVRALPRIDVKLLAEALKKMPVRARGGEERVTERLNEARLALRRVEEELWKVLLAEIRWRSPLLVMDEAHHLKNPGTALARQLQSPDCDQDLRTGDGAMARAFERMLFLTATPFQLGHHELLRVLERFGDVRWDAQAFGELEEFRAQLADLGKHLDESQRKAIALQRKWSQLRPEDCDINIEEWWQRIQASPREGLSHHQRSVVEAYVAAKGARDAAQQALRRWILRHNKHLHWQGTEILRRHRKDGAAILGQEGSCGLPIPPQQLLPFFLAARSAVQRGQDLLGEALCSSYEAFRFTRQYRVAEKDEQDESVEYPVDLSHSVWYLSEFDRALQGFSGSIHPKISSTVQKVVDLWEAGEKVLVFAFYRQTCRALHLHISQEIERRIKEAGQRQLQETGRDVSIEQLVERLQKRYFDDHDSPGHRALEGALCEILRPRAGNLAEARVSADDLIDVMRRFLRVATTLVRCFPIADMDAISPNEAIARTLDHTDTSGMTWRQKFDGFVRFLVDQCSSEERRLYLEAARRTRTRGIWVEDDEDEGAEDRGGIRTLANVQVATGETKRDNRVRRMRAFNTPFFPDILVCSQVMGEGVDLQRFCRHVIHHDLDWNPSTIEQRTGRVDRLGCKAEGREPIGVYLPYLAGTADERQYRVMSDREQWFRVVMGQDEVARLITPESNSAIKLPDSLSTELRFQLGLEELHTTSSPLTPASA